MKNKFNNNMSKQVYSLPELIRNQYEDLEPKTRKVLSFQEIFNIQKILIMGCGDSYAAALSTKSTFESLTNLPVEVVTAIDLARFYPENQLGFDSLNPLVITVSNSGTGARVNEAIERAKKHGCYVLGITGNDESEMARLVDKVLNLEIPKFESAPGVRSYLVSIMSLLLLAIRIGEVKKSYTMDQAMNYREDMLKQSELLELYMDDIVEKSIKVAEEWSDFDYFDFIGAGPDYAISFFGQAKILEATGKIAMHINSEEWFHLNFFARDSEHIGTVINASKDNNAMSRNLELVKYANVLKRPTVVITDGTKSDFNNVDVTYIRVPSARYGFNNALTHFVPNALIPAYISEIIGEEYGRGTKGKWEFAAGGAGVKESKIEIL